MELRHLRYFVAVSEELNFRRAADVLRVAQPSLSQQIRQLEQEIGVVLFERTHHKVQLTQAGEAFYVRAKSILLEATQAVRDARATEQGEAGAVVIGFVSSAANVVLPKVLHNVRENLPRAQVELKELMPSEQIEALYRNSIDLGFSHATLEEPNFDFLVVARERLMVALPNSSRFSHQSTVDLKSLANEPAIMPGKSSILGYFEHVRAVYQAANIQPARVYHTRLLQTGLLLVAAGLGVSLVPESFRDIRINGVIYRRLTVEPAPIDLLAIWRRDNASPVLLRIVSHLRALQASSMQKSELAAGSK